MMPVPKRDDGAPWRNLHGRRRGKNLRPGQSALMDQALGALSVDGVDWAENPTRAPLDLAALFGRECPVWLEVGFGSGEYLLHLAETHPDTGFIGCEPFVNGVAALLAKIETAGVENIRIHPGDARDLLEVLPGASLARAYLLYPDPWPKRRHHKRRFVSDANIDALSRALLPGAEFRMATDIADYVRQSMAVMSGRNDFDWLAGSPADWRKPWDGWQATRYEQKARREGRSSHYLRFCKL